MLGKLKKAFIMTIPILTGYIVLGMGFGIMLESKGYGVLWAFGMSVTMFAGSMQYLAVDLLASGASYISAAIATITVNARHIFYGITMVDKYKDAGKEKPYLIFGLTDETYSLVCNDEIASDKKLCFFITLLDQLYWITGCILGNIVGSVVPFDFKGVDFVLTALFVCIFTDQWITHKDHLPAIVGVCCSFVCLLGFGTEYFLIPSMITITLCLKIAMKIRNKRRTKKVMGK